MFQDDKFSNQATTERAKMDLALFGTLRRSTREGVSGKTKAVRFVFGLLAWAAAVVAAIYAHNRSGSVWLSVFVGLLVLNLVGRGVADVITDSKKVRRAIYFLLLPGIATAIFYGSYKAWHMWWLAFVLGIVLGQIISTIIAQLFLADIHREEKEDSLRRWRQAV